MASLIIDSFFCPRNADGVREVCCPLQGIVPRPKTKPKVAPKGLLTQVRRRCRQLSLVCPTSQAEFPASLWGTFKSSALLVADECSLQGGAAAECVLYSACSPFVQLLVNLQRPFPPEVPDLMRSGWLCGLENSGGILLPKICCPEAALAQTPPAPAHPFSSHSNLANVASPGKCGVPTTFARIVGGQVGLLVRPPDFNFA